MKKFIIYGMLAAIITGVVGGSFALSVGNKQTNTVVVTDKQVKRKGESDDKYLVFTKKEDGSIIVFENTDTFLFRKFNSSDYQGELEIGKTYDITSVGYRIPFFSAYQNIIDVKEKK